MIKSSVMLNLRPSRYLATVIGMALFLVTPFAEAHNITCAHNHVNAFRVHCDPCFAECTENNKPGRCITQKTSGLIPTWDCNCVTSDAAVEPTEKEQKAMDRELKKMQKTEEHRQTEQERKY